MIWNVLFIIIIEVSDISKLIEIVHKKQINNPLELDEVSFFLVDLFQSVF